MADYVPITSGQTDPGAPITSALMKALEENPRAIAEGAPGAPRIDGIAAMTHQGLGNSVGTYVFARRTDNADTGFQGGVPGSLLRPTSAAWSVTTGTSPEGTSFNNGPALDGTWRCMGQYDGISTSGGGFLTIAGATLWLRIA